MKFLPTTWFRGFLSIGLVLGAIGAAQATTYSVFTSDGRINMGNDSLFTVLTVGGSNYLSNSLSNSASITGNVGIAGKGNYTTSSGTITGDLYMNSFGNLSITGTGKVTGKKHGARTSQGEDGTDETTTLANALADANSLASAAAALAHTSNYSVTQGSFTQGQSINITSSSNAITINGATNNPFNQPVVLSINSFTMSSGNLTLTGNSHTTFVLNITGNFTMNSSANILLTGGVLASHVLFNLEGTTSNTFTVAMGDSASGVFLAPNRNVSMDGKIYGRLITNQLCMSCGGQVVSQ
ncbi:MAG TPA: hypothetical protein VEI58_03705 [Chthoniobacterales bacterium]|nr:hypothetical protein [Chthoniobacterales bacterium]